MRKLFTKVSLALVLITGVASAFADPDEYPARRDAMRAARQQRMTEQQDEQRREFMIGQRAERRRQADANAPVQGAGQNPSGNNLYGVAPDAPQRPGRMTPEERRALRRQINEAGRDIYAPPR